MTLAARCWASALVINKLIGSERSSSPTTSPPSTMMTPPPALLQRSSLSSLLHRHRHRHRHSHLHHHNHQGGQSNGQRRAEQQQVLAKMEFAVGAMPSLRRSEPAGAGPLLMLTSFVYASSISHFRLATIFLDLLAL